MFINQLVLGLFAIRTAGAGAIARAPLLALSLSLSLALPLAQALALPLALPLAVHAGTLPTLLLPGCALLFSLRRAAITTPALASRTGAVLGQRCRRRGAQQCRHNTSNY